MPVFCIHIHTHISICVKLLIHVFIGGIRSSSASTPLVQAPLKVELGYAYRSGFIVLMCSLPR